MKANNVWVRTIVLALIIILDFAFVASYKYSLEALGIYITVLALMYPIFKSLEKYEEDSKIKSQKVVFIKATLNTVEFNNKINTELDNLIKDKCKIVNVNIISLKDDKKEAYIFFVKN